MGRCLVILVGVTYVGLLLLVALGLWALEGTPDWDLGSSFLFVTTFVTTIGYGWVAPSTPWGRALCTLLALLGVPATMGLLGATITRLSPALIDRPQSYLRAQWGCSSPVAAGAHLALMLVVATGLLVLLPATIFSHLEVNWSYWDSVYFCITSLATIGLGELVPGGQLSQPWRQLYQVALAVYLLVGLGGVLLLAQSFRRLLEVQLGDADDDIIDDITSDVTAATSGTSLAPNEATGLLGESKGHQGRA